MTPEQATVIGEAVQRLDEEASAELINAYTKGEPHVTVRVATSKLRAGAMVWDYEAAKRATLWLNPMFAERPLHAKRIGPVLPQIQAYHRSAAAQAGRVVVHLPDTAHGRGLGFSSGDPDTTLIPDPVFVVRRAYADARRTYREQELPWDQKKPIVFWRGSGSGGARRNSGPDWRQRPRIRLAALVKDNPLFDVGLSRLAKRQIVDEAMFKEVEAQGLIRGYVPSDQFVNYKYQVDIDGNSNAWAGLFLKLLTGCPVLKIASPQGFRQWYYERMIPGQHFIPVRPDMSDLVEQAEWLLAHDNEARDIGQRALELANAMTLEGELEAAVPAIARAMAVEDIRMA